MDNVQRLIIYLLFLLSAFLPNLAHADYWKDAYTQTQYATSQLACQFNATQNGKIYVVSTETTITPVQCLCKLSSGSAAQGCGMSTKITAACVAPLVKNPTTGICEPPPCPAGENDLNGAYYSGNCVGGCLHWTQQPVLYIKGDSTGYLSLRANTGASCSTSSKSYDQGAADAAAAAKAADDAAKAAAKSAADAKAASDSAAAKAAAAAAAKAAADAKDAKDAAAAKAAASKAAAAAAAADSTKTQAEKDAAAATAAADASDAAAKAAAANTATGSAAGAALPDKAKDPIDFCELHPSSSICKTSSVAAGYCLAGVSVGFNCDGDGIQCAIAAEQQKRNCEFFKTDDALTAKYNEALNDTGVNNPAKAGNEKIVNIASSLDASSPYAGQCNSDVTISFNGDSVVVPFSAWCPELQALGYLFLAMAYMAAAVILGSAV